jgi:hypothetical protein
MKPQGNFTIWAVLFVSCLFGSVASTASAVFAQKEFRVTEVVLKADDAKMSGQCPIRVNFTGYITANGAGTVKYTFGRSDGATGPVYTLDFKEAGTQAVSTDWTLGDAALLPFYEGWQTVRILSPSESESSRETGKFSISCGTAVSKPLPPERSLSFTVDGSLKPTVSQLPARDKNGAPRTVASVADAGGAQADFVENELLVMSDDQKIIRKILERWNGQIVETIDLKQFKLGAPAAYLIRIDAALADSEALAADLQKITRDGRGEHRVSSAAGLKLLAVAARERAAGFPVSANFLLYPRNIASGTTSEAALSFTAGWSPDAFSWSYMSRGSAQNLGIGAAWQMLDRRMIANRVKIAVLDEGFVTDTDIAPSAVFIGRIGIPGPAATPFHGANVVDALMGLPDNNWGAAGAAGPVADPIIIDRGLDLFNFISALGRAAGSGARIVNMSFGTSIPAALAVVPGGLLNILTDDLRRHNILLLAAAPNVGTLDVDALDGIWESSWDMPCENDFVICVGGMGDDTRSRDPRSSFTSRFGANATGIDIFGPFNVWVSEDPNDGLMPRATLAKKVSGNSFATPITAGIAGLVMAADPNLSADQVERILLETAQRGTSPADVPLRPDALAAVCRALPGGCPPPAPATSDAGSFRITVNGFTINRETVDAFLDDDGAKDEVFLMTDANLFDTRTNRNQPTRQTRVIGDSNTRPERIRGGSASSLGGGNGGFQAGDNFPAGATPWIRRTAPTDDRPPLLAWEGELRRDRNALALIPSIWESDNDSRLIDRWTSSLANTWIAIGGDMRTAIARRSGFEPTAAVRETLKRSFDSVRIAHGNDPKDRPIGMDDFGMHYGYTPQMLVLTYDAADRLARTDFGLGAGILRLSFRDNNAMRGDYVLYIQVERVR